MFLHGQRQERLTRHATRSLGVYILGGEFGTPGVRNAVVDVLYSYFGEATDNHRSPDMRDVEYIFARTPDGAPMRRFLVAHALFTLSARTGTTRRCRRTGPTCWPPAATLVWMATMLAEWNWHMGHNAPRMTIKPRVEFHEKVPKVQQQMDAPVKMEEREYRG